MSKERKVSGPDNLKECKLYVEGMHCASCEVLIEKKLLKQENIESVDASLANNEVNVVYKDKAPNLELINKDFKELGYRFSTKGHKKEKEEGLFTTSDDGAIYVNKKKFTYLTQVLGIALILLIAFFVFDGTHLSSKISITQTSTLPTFFVFGLLAGLSSCAALVGGVLLSLSKQWNEIYIAEDNNTARAKPHIMFHIGRLISFVIFGGLLGLIGKTLSISLGFTSLLTIAVGFMMIVLGLQMLEVKWASKFQFRLPKSIGRFAANEDNFKGKYMPFVVGMLTFLLPCGFTIVAQGIALISGSFIKGALIMLLFVLGTLPMLGLISFSSVGFTKKPRLTAKFNKIAGLIVIFFAIYNINAQLNVLGLTSLSDIRLFTKSTKASTPTEVAYENGTQLITMTAKGFEYIPTSSTTIKAGQKTVLKVDNQGIEGCGTYMSGRGLFDGYLQLKPGISTVAFTPQKGQYKITCSMGMVPPITITVE